MLSFSALRFLARILFPSPDVEESDGVGEGREDSVEEEEYSEGGFGPKVEIWRSS